MFILGPNMLIDVKKSSGNDASGVGKESFDMSVLEVLAVISSYRDQHRKTISSKQDEARARGRRSFQFMLHKKNGPSYGCSVFRVASD